MAVSVIIEGLTKVFPPNVIALKNVNLEIRPKEFFVILGPSGSGKTTLLRIIAGLEVPTKGRVIIGDRVVVDAEKGIYVEPKERNIGMVFQNWALYPHMTAYDNIAFPLRIKKLPKNEIDRRVKEVAEALGIRDLLNRKPSQMSGGQQQRVALARALAKHPDVLLLDEPFSNLDARIRITAREFVKEIQKRLGITTILVTHDQADAFAVGDRVMVLRNGETQQVGTPKELFDEPSNIFVANFIGNPPMNLVKLNIKDPLIRLLNQYYEVPSDLKKVYIGIRPDDALASLETGGKLIIKGKVTLTEYLGSRKYVKVVIKDNVVLKVLADDNVNEGSTVNVVIKKVHIFNESGARLKTLTLT